jgi:hypothetical protein
MDVYFVFTHSTLMLNNARQTTKVYVCIYPQFRGASDTQKQHRWSVGPFGLKLYTRSAGGFLPPPLNN